MYPTEEDLHKIIHWNQPAYKQLMSCVYHMFISMKFGICKYTGRQRHGHRYTLITSGWSGCEDVIHALQSNTQFWHRCWYQSTVGGKYVLYIPSDLHH